jgi:Flp pilus assembly protein TadG
MVEFALVTPIIIFLFFGVLEGSLLVFTMGAFRNAAAAGAIRDAELGNATYADTQQGGAGPTGAVQVILSSPGVAGLATITEIDIYRLTSQPGGQLTVDNSAYNKYPQNGGAASVTWAPAIRNVRNGFSDFLGVTITYQYQWKSGSLLGTAPLQLTQNFYARLEPESY